MEELSTTRASGPGPRTLLGEASTDGADGIELPPLCSGDTLGRYEIVRLLGQGGMGRVYEGRDPTLDRPVAIKVLFRRHDQMDLTDGQLRLRREAKALAALSHPNVVQVFDLGSTDGHVWIAMELVEGETMAQWIEPRRPLGQMLARFEEAARGLSAAHAAGLVHRDFKLTNVMVDPSGRARVLDFGLSTAFFSDDEPPTRTGSVDPDPELFTTFGNRVGTPLYMSPEQFHGEPTDARTDQFALAVSLHLALHGTYPEQVLDQSPRAMSVELPDRPLVPAAVGRVIARGMALHPDDRYPNIEAMMAALRRAARPWYARWPVRIGALLLAGGGLAWAAWPADDPLCQGARGQLDEVWNVGLQQQIEQAVAKDTPSRLAWERARDHLQAYSDRWVQTHQQACEAGRDGVTALDRQMACLDRRLAELDGATEAFTREGASARGTLGAALGLPRPEACLDPEALAAEPIPDDAELAVRVEMMRHSLARIRGSIDGGDYRSADDRAALLLTEAEALGFAPLVAEAVAVQAQAANGLRDAERTRALLERAYHEASGSGHDEQALKSAIDLVYVIGALAHAPQEAEVWVRQAEALLERMGNPPEHAAQLQLNRGLLAYGRGDYAEAIEVLERCAASMIEAGKQGTRLANVYNNLGISYQQLGRVKEAQAAYERALTIYTESLGDTHPVVGQLLANLGAAQRRLGDLTAARQSLERSIEAISTLGPDHASLYGPLINLGNLDVVEGKPLDGIPRLERAVTVLEKARGADTPLLAEPLDALGGALAAANRHEQAERTYGRAVGLLDGSNVSRPALRAHALMGQGKALLSLDRATEAEAKARDAVASYEALDADPGPLGEAKLLLAEALGDGAEARTLAQEALVLFERAEDRGPQAERARRWLAEHPEAPGQ